MWLLQREVRPAFKPTVPVNWGTWVRLISVCHKTKEQRKRERDQETDSFNYRELVVTGGAMGGEGLDGIGDGD